jgi:hypothetical protein
MTRNAYILTAAALLLAPAAGLAQGAISLNVWPPKIELTAMPGESRTGIINVDNKGSAVARVAAYIADVGMDRSGNLSFPEGGSLPFSCEPWLLINPEQFNLAQGSSQQVRYTLRVPPDAAGSYLASIFFQTRPEDRPFATGSAISARIGSMLIVTVPGGGTKSAELISLGARQSPDGKGTQVELGIRNKGNVMLRPSGTIEIKSEAGWTVEKFSFNADKQAVLPFSERLFPIPISATVEPGAYRLISTVDYGGRELLAAETKINLVAATPLPAAKAAKAVDKGKTGRPKAEPRGEPARAPKASQEEISALLAQGTKLYSAGDYQQALAVWQRVLKADPGNSTASRNLARTREKIEALKKAKQGG